jgi:hypothetical protein
VPDNHLSQTMWKVFVQEKFHRAADGSA